MRPLLEHYPRDTLGYHYLMARAVFGTESPACTFLAEKAEESPRGFDEKVIAPEEQVVYLLTRLHFGNAEEERADPSRPGPAKVEI